MVQQVREACEEVQSFGEGAINIETCKEDNTSEDDYGTEENE